MGLRRMLFLNNRITTFENVDGSWGGGMWGLLLEM
jgi:hypothetical protein